MSRHINELAKIVLEHVYQLGYQHRSDIGKHHETADELVAAERKLVQTEQELQRLRELLEEVQSEELTKARAEIEALRKDRDGAVRELQQVKANRDETEAKRKLLHEALTRIVAELSEAAAKYWPDHDPSTIAIATFMGEIERLRAEIETLRQQLDAAQAETVDVRSQRTVETDRLNTTNVASVQQRDEIAYLRTRLDEERSMIASLRKQLDAAQAALTRERLNADEQGREIETLRRTERELTQAYSDACQDANRLVCVEQDLLAEIDTLKGAMDADNKRLRDAEEKVWPGLSYGCNAPDKMADEILHLRQQRDPAQAALTRERLDAEARGDETHRLRLDHARLGRLVEARGQELERLETFVEVMRGLLTEEYADQRIIAEALAELDAGTTEPAPVAETPDAEGGA